MTTFERLFINISTFIVGLSGLIYAVMKHLMAVQDPYSLVSHPLQPWVLDLHVLASPVMVFAIGLILQGHILPQLRKGGSRFGRGTGVVALSCLLPMIATGYLIQVFTDETARWICVLVHLATGSLYLGVFIAHLMISRRIAALRRASAAQAAAARVSRAAWLKQQAGPRPASRQARGAAS